jgi:hypothetical protein
VLTLIICLPYLSVDSPTEITTSMPNVLEILENLIYSDQVYMISQLIAIRPDIVYLSVRESTLIDTYTNIRDQLRNFEILIVSQRQIFLFSV